MVSLWPFRGKDGTPDAIEKKLSQMGAQIEEHEKRLNGLRGRSRRLKALWTLYTILIWAIYTTILVLAVGLKNASIESITGLVATPFVIYVVRQFISTYYDWRTTSHETALESLRSQQRETIEELKKITKYNSTQALLERYGASAGITTGAQPQDKQGNAAQRKGGPQQQHPQQHPQHPQNGQQQQQQQQHPHDPNQPPPPTIEAPPRPGSQSGRPMSAQSHMSGMTGITDISQMPSEGMMMHPPPHPHMMGPNVLPPAWEEPPREPQWYDRILDVLLGEDEMAAKSRFALICSNCRQVNGLAPPGTADVANIRFMCGRCGAENGKPDVKEIIGKVVAEDRDEGSDVGTPDDTGARRRSSSSKKGSSKKKSGKTAPRQIVEEPTEEEQEGGGSDESSEEVVVVKKKKKGRK